MSTNEVTLLESGTVRVTNLRVLIADKTYALSNITSVEMGRKEASSCGPAFFIMAGVGSAIMAFVQLSGRSSFPFGWFIAAAILIGLGILVVRTAKPDFTVKVGSASGESNILASPDEKSIRQIVDAINQAIVQRG